VARANPGHPSLLILDDPLQCFNGILLLPDLLLETIEMFEDQSHVNAHLVDLLSMTIHPAGNMIDLLLVILEGLLLGNDVSPEVRLQSVALVEQSIRGSITRKGCSYLLFQLKVFGQHSHLDSSRMTHGLRRLVQAIIGLLPIEDPGLEKIVQDRIVQLLLVQSQQVVMASDHVSPEAIIHVEI